MATGRKGQGRKGRGQRPAGAGLPHDRGAVAVEAALLTPVLLILVFGILEVGFLIKDYLAISSAASAGVRTATTLNPDFTSNAAATVGRNLVAVDRSDVIVWVYLAEPGQEPDPTGESFCEANRCVRFTGWDDEQGRFTDESGTWPWQSVDTCLDSRESVAVHVRLEHATLTRFLFGDVTMNEDAVSAFEPSSQAQCAAGPG